MDRSTLKKALLDIFERSVGESVGAVEEDMTLREGLNLDSIDLVSMAIEAQTAFNIELRAEELNGVITVKDLLDLIQAKLAANPSQQAA
jgi:acyl carrier protein